MRNARQNHALEVFEDVLDRLALLGAMRGKAVDNLLRLHRREHRIPLRRFQIIGDPIDQLMTELPEFTHARPPFSSEAATPQTISKTLPMPVDSPAPADSAAARPFVRAIPSRV